MCSRSEFIPNRQLNVMTLTSDGPHHKYLLQCLSSHFNICSAVVEPANYMRRRLLHARKYRLYGNAVYHWLRRKITGSDRARRRFFDNLTAWGNMSPVLTDNINSQQVVQTIDQQKPDVIIVMGTSILRSDVLHATGGIPIINIHGGYLPHYKGNHCFFFAYLHNEFDKIGSTIHFIDCGVDSGDIIQHIVPTITSNDTPETLYCKAERKAILTICDLLQQYCKGIPFNRIPQEKIGRVYYLKDRKLRHEVQYWLRRRISRNNNESLELQESK